MGAHLGALYWLSMISAGATFHAIGMAITALLASSCLLGQDPSWMNLSHIDRGNTYSVILRSGTCLRGTIQSVNPDSLSLALPTAPRLVEVARLDALQVKDGLYQFDILYSGRSSWSDVQGSSWSDVQAAPSHSREYLSLVLKSGKSVNGQPVGSTDSQVSVKLSGTVTNIAKADIALVDYVRIKPFSERIRRGMVDAGPLVFLVPQVWPYILNVGVQLRVPLFNSMLPEDDSILQCPIRQ